MTESFGSAFVSQYGDEPNNSWAAGLAPYSDQEIQKGFTGAIAANYEFVPSLSRFIGHITTKESWESNRLHKAYDAEERLPDLGEGRLLAPPADHMTPQEHIAALKELVGVEKC